LTLHPFSDIGFFHGLTLTSRFLYITTLQEDRIAETRKNISQFSVQRGFACVPKDTSWILAVWYQARLVCVEITQLESIFLHQIFRTKHLPTFCYSNHNFTTFFHVKAAFLHRRMNSIGERRTELAGLSTVHHSPGLISSYLAGEDKSTKNVPATTESNI
jgi:hypothetical protein